MAIWEIMLLDFVLWWMFDNNLSQSIDGKLFHIIDYTNYLARTLRLVFSMLAKTYEKLNPEILDILLIRSNNTTSGFVAYCNMIF